MYGIQYLRRYYGPTPDVRGWVGAVPGSLYGPDGQLAFTTREEARAWIAEADQTVYYQSRGEYGRPEYQARKLPSRRDVP